MNKIAIGFLILANIIFLNQSNALENIYQRKCPENCEFGYNFLNNNDTWTCKCAKDICEELECAQNSTCKIKYKQKCVDNVCTRFKTVYCQSNKKDGLCPSSLSINSVNKTCLQDVDCTDNDKCCPSAANGGNFCAKPCFKPKCNCKQNYVNEYKSNSKGCPMCHCIKRKLEKIEICSLPKEIGPCRAAHNRFYFNSSTKQCEKFIYGGCHGNENNFLTIDDCEMSCNAFKVENKNEISNKCQLTKETGPCKANFQRYYFNSTTKLCEKFVYGGCKGNENNFETLEKCESECSTLKDPISQEVTINKCSLDKETGPCMASHLRYYFNKATKRCEEFIYGGCQGNANNFESLDECSKECSIKPRNFKVNKCNSNPDGGFCRGFMERYFYNKTSERCEVFIYGGCGGNANNFERIEDCLSECSTIAVVANEIKINDGVNYCELEKEVGPCRAYFERFYYNKNTKSCEKFGYGGCKGNSNNFNNKEECERECITNRNFVVKPQENAELEKSVLKAENTKPELCSLERSIGHCKAMFPRYYFNKLSQKCEQFIWGGCGGNENNFLSEEECNNVCNNPN